MPPLPKISGQEAITAFQKLGYKFARQKGSHITLVKPGSFHILTVPDHKELDRGTLKSLINKAGITVDDFLKLLSE